MSSSKIQKQKQFALSLRNFRDATDEHACEKQLRIVWESRPDHFRAESREELRSYVEQFLSKKENDEILGGDPAKLFDVFGRPQRREHTFALAVYDEQPSGFGEFGNSRSRR